MVAAEISLARCFGRGDILFQRYQRHTLGLVRMSSKFVERRLFEAEHARDILVCTSDDPFVVRLLPPLILGLEHVALLASALAELAP